MSRTRVISLYSGSVGNAFLIRTAGGTVLIDAGKNAKKLCAALAEAEVSPDEIDAVFITHEHSDHISALPVFLKKHPLPVHVQNASAYKLACQPSVAPHLCLHPPLYSEQIGNMRVTSFQTPHDSRGSLGYRIDIQKPDGTMQSIGYATDIGYVSKDVEDALMGCQTVILESNHDPDMLMEGPYPYDLKLRIASRRGHLSNPDSAEFAARLCENGTCRLMLAHLSQENNTPDTAYDACISALGREDVCVAVAAPDGLTEIAWED